MRGCVVSRQLVADSWQYHCATPPLVVHCHGLTPNRHTGLNGSTPFLPSSSSALVLRCPGEGHGRGQGRARGQGDGGSECRIHLLLCHQIDDRGPGLDDAVGGGWEVVFDRFVEIGEVVTWDRGVPGKRRRRRGREGGGLGIGLTVAATATATATATAAAAVTAAVTAAVAHCHVVQRILVGELANDVLPPAH